MADAGMDGFCGSKFWDINQTWPSEYDTIPDFTFCFERTVLAWIPCAFLWVFSIFEVSYILQSRYKDVPFTWLNISKFIATFALTVVAIVDLIYAIVQSSSTETYPVDYVTPIVLAISFILVLVFQEANRRKGLVTSGLLFQFWLYLAICGAFEFRTLILSSSDLAQEDVVYASGDFRFVTYLIHYSLVLVMLVLNGFADAPPRFSEYPKVDNMCPEARSSFLSRMTFSWFDKLAWLGFRKPLENKDLWNMNPLDTSAYVVPVFEKYWNQSVQKAASTNGPKASFRKTSGNAEFDVEFSTAQPKTKQKNQASIVPAICKAFGPIFLLGSFMKFLQDLLGFVNPQLLKLLINFVEQDEPLWRGMTYAVLMFVTASLQTIILSQYFNRMFIVGLRVRTALISTIYRKALRLSNSARKESTVGEIVNLMSVDAQRFMDLTAYLNMLWSAPLQIGLSLYFLYQILGPSVFAGLAVMIILIPVNGFIANRIKTLQIRQMKNKDQRVKLMNEILSGIKVLKLYAWEPSFEQQILKIRDKEIEVLKQAAYLNAGTSFVWACAPFLVSLVTFAVFVLSSDDNILDSETAFVSLSLFNMLRFPLSMLPMMISSMVQASVSVKRLNKFMNMDEIDPTNVGHDPSESDPIVMENGTFSWGPDESPVLKGINMRCKQGSLVAVVGTVGSGKSSLVSAFLGEMEKITGRVNTKGSMAYVSQQAWIQNATLQNNITFSKVLDNIQYNRIVEACALKPDIDMLPGGDQTEIGEKGINLSGGQKQRVSLARAVYYDADVYFFDDPLSAVDSHVGKHIFDNVLGPKGLLKKKTRILVTHGITYLPDVDNIVVLKDGEISEVGTYNELIAKKGAFAEFLLQHIQERAEEDGTDFEDVKQQLEKTLGTESVQRQLSRQKSSDSASLTGSLSRSFDGSEVRRRKNSKENSVPPEKKVGQKLIEVEKSETGSVKWDVYAHYLMSIGIFLTVATLFLNVLYQGFSIGTNVWLSIWSNAQTAYNATQPLPPNERDMYLGVYGGLGIGQVVFVFLGSLVVFLGTLMAAKKMHMDMTNRILRCPMYFFDTTPVGRVLSRFSKDIDTCDVVLPQIMQALPATFFRVLATIVVISYSTPIFLAVIIPIGILYYFIQRFYVATSRQLKRLESVSRSPIYSHFGESVTGTSTIRAYGAQDRFMKESEQKVDFNQIAYYPSIIANRWLAVRLEMVGNLIIFFSALFAVLGKETMNPGLVGLSVSYALQITQTLNWLVRMTGDVETNIVAVERIKEYGETKQEAAWDIPETKPPKEWPANGNVVFNNYQVRYREGLDLVLHGISCDIKGGEKVGIVGRTGAGKSSLTLGLFRIIEAAGGSIVIDNVDIAKLGLHSLRSRLTIIPQDPVLFSGTLRLNLDPFEQYKDEEVWRALEHAHLKHFVKGLPAGLSHEVSEGGENLSVGQRQLICLARALLRKTKVLVLDEATAAVDLETDDLIQQTIRSEFKDCTVLTIAHRLNTILDSDRVVVLDKGKIIEFESPNALLQRKQSAFYGMAKDAGIVS
ncbi:multidrug resistance-associated protein 1 isoform X3 [Neocloeon triangulifer]|uniref:multidrug resistance-associated protein 1 isoform X3 n=1 Tax=Neocloeon triangulifer TaxID=2078957 RepID=UPI00286ED5BD|nr:multidrug resistance-associated protein 1 isoform X3 [Neocloeon triangulifer]